MELVHCRARRRFSRGLKRKPVNLMRRLRKAKKEAAPMGKPDVVKTHLRNMIILPEMIGRMVGVYSGKTFNQVETKPEMVGHYLGEFSISYKPVKHGRPGPPLSGADVRANVFPCSRHSRVPSLFTAIKVRSRSPGHQITVCCLFLSHASSGRHIRLSVFSQALISTGGGFMGFLFRCPWRDYSSVQRLGVGRL